LMLVGSAQASAPKLFDQAEFSCADLAETINYYVDLGEDATLADFAKRHADIEKSDRRGYSIVERICLLCRVLYEPKSPQPLRDAMIFGLQLPYEPMPASKWPLFPVAQAGKSYFVLSQGRSGGGRPERMEDYLKYCQENGKFRSKPVSVPTREEALKDAEALRNSDAWKEIKWKWRGDANDYYEFSESRVWDYIVKQARSVPASPAPAGAGIQSAVDPNVAIQKAIQAQYSKYCKAQNAKEIDGVMAIFASDFVRTGFRQSKTTYAQYRAQKLKWFANIASIQSHVDINSIQITGDTATVHIHEGDLETEPVKLKNGLVEGSIGDSWRIETWIKKNGVWLLSSSKMGM